MAIVGIGLIGMSIFFWLLGLRGVDILAEALGVFALIVAFLKEFMDEED